LHKAVAKYLNKATYDPDIANRSPNSIAREVEKGIVSSTAVRWLKKLGFKYKEYQNRIYKDEHERIDVKQYRDMVFLPKMAAYRKELRLSDEDLNIIGNTHYESGEVESLILVTRNECTFVSNNGQHYIWVHNEYKLLRKKGRVQGLHLSDFLTPIGRLGEGDAAVIIKCSGDIW